VEAQWAPTRADAATAPQPSPLCRLARRRPQTSASAVHSASPRSNPEAMTHQSVLASRQRKKMFGSRSCGLILFAPFSLSGNAAPFGGV